MTHYIHIGPKWQCLPQTRTRTSSSQSKTWQLQTRRNTPRSPLNTLKRRLRQKQASRWRIWPFANCFIISLSNYIFLRERKNIISFWETISKVDGQSGSSSDMALLQVDEKINNLTKSLIGMGENVSGNTGGPDWRDACCGGGQLHLWGAWQEGQVWDHTHQVCPITRYLHDWGCQVLCFFSNWPRLMLK